MTLAVATMTAALGLCVAAGVDSGSGGEAAFLPWARFTLGWTHSRERTRWEETYRIDVVQGAPRLTLEALRVKGSGAGIDPPPSARWVDGWYVDRPAPRPLERLVLTVSAYAADYELCDDRFGSPTTCRALGTFLNARDSISLSGCRRPENAE